MSPMPWTAGDIHHDLDRVEISLPLPLCPSRAPVIEKYTRNARFCLICNYVSKIIPALQSRCTRFRFAPLGAEFVRQRLQHVVSSEG